SLTNLHGDLMANIDADGHFAVSPTQMGARVYIAELGRFLSVDPIEGGTLNNYVYAMDPVNQVDVSGKAVPILSVAWMIVKATLSAGARVLIPAALGFGPIRGPIRFPRVPFRSIPRPSPLPGRHFAIPNHAQSMIGRIRANNFSPPPGVSSKPYQNNPQKFGTGEKPPDFDRLGQPIKYREYDVHPLKPGVNRGRERIVVGNDSSIYYTNDHYETFTIVEQGGIVNKQLW
ncbi:MAG: RHS repeat-associated core domain-containing protein, partial [Candidatus Saccharibacteria bacterium]|nr:RHS repeat-associated core domain-containing protein [Candidatus Saccharibacteria bacterium]